MIKRSKLPARAVVATGTVASLISQGMVPVLAQSAAELSPVEHINNAAAPQTFEQASAQLAQAKKDTESKKQAKDAADRVLAAVQADIDTTHQAVADAEQATLNAQNAGEQAFEQIKAAALQSLAEAEKEQDAAEDALVRAANDVEAKKTAVETATQELEAAKQKQKELADANPGAAEKLAEDQANLARAQQDQKQASQDLNAAQERVASAETNLATITASLDEAQNKVTSATTAFEQAKAEVLKAQDSYNTAKEAYDAAVAAEGDNNTNTALNNGKAELERAKQAVDNASNELAAAQQ
ncbi:hypothetical protein KPC83_01130 [Collinsella sp. zg1085]|uniref:hypothetical protein n=1 Tax=Collinsella sp. zg1085 TaxID=2844380 RepID=UPI001C0C3D59|nr:hypothetical protein [Collinsella sp. zg1085]QWT17794.1 hypothetical protein KPC83_01130 [Collinsella sp. zg1085]